MNSVIIKIDNRITNMKKFILIPLFFLFGFSSCTVIVHEPAHRTVVVREVRTYEVVEEAPVYFYFSGSTHYHSSSCHLVRKHHHNKIIRIHGNHIHKRRLTSCPHCHPKKVIIRRKSTSAPKKVIHHKSHHPQRKVIIRKRK